MSAIPLVAAPTEAELEFDRQIDALAQTGMAERSIWPTAASAPGSSRCGTSCPMSAATGTESRSSS